MLVDAAELLADLDRGDAPIRARHCRQGLSSLRAVKVAGTLTDANLGRARELVDEAESPLHTCRALAAIARVWTAGR